MQAAAILCTIAERRWFTMNINETHEIICNPNTNLLSKCWRRCCKNRGHHAGSCCISNSLRQASALGHSTTQSLCSCSNFSTSEYQPSLQVRKMIENGPLHNHDVKSRLWTPQSRCPWTTSPDPRIAKQARANPNRHHMTRSPLHSLLITSYHICTSWCHAAATLREQQAVRAFPKQHSFLTTASLPFLAPQ